MEHSPQAPETFHGFRLLPPELRDQIWRMSMPSLPETLIYPHRRGCWRLNRIGQHIFEYCTSLLSSPECRVEQLLVCREARRAAQVWINDQFRRGPHSFKGSTLTRNFRPNSDILYISEAKWVDWHSEVLDDVLTLSVGDGYSYSALSWVTRTAVCQAHAMNDTRAIEDMCFSEEHCFTKLHTVYFLVNTPSDLQPPTHEHLCQELPWTVEVIPGFEAMLDKDHTQWTFYDEERRAEDADAESHLSLLEQVISLVNKACSNNAHFDEWNVRLACAVPCEGTTYTFRPGPIEAETEPQESSTD